MSNLKTLPHTPATRAAMLAELDVADINALFADIPAAALHTTPLPELPTHQPEWAVAEHFKALAALNTTAEDGPFFLGAGCYRHHIPAAVDALIQRGEFLTAYTPYQPEVSQGTLTAIFEFQSILQALTGMDVANASLYDGATATVEAALLAHRVTKRPDVLLATPLNPQYHNVLTTYWQEHGGNIRTDGPADDRTAAIIVQTPDFRGTTHQLAHWRQQADACGALLIVVVTEILSLGLLPAPAEADIVCGEGQSLGNPMSAGGPHLGFFACQKAYLRQMPGRLVGATVDAADQHTFTLTLNTREQHIRREKATSNICTNQGLCALAFTIHANLLGETGFKKLALLNHAKACQLADKLTHAGLPPVNSTFFNEFTIRIPQAPAVQERLYRDHGILGGIPADDTHLLLCATELTTEADMDALVHALTH